MNTQKVVKPKVVVKRAPVVKPKVETPVLAEEELDDITRELIEVEKAIPDIAVAAESAKLDELPENASDEADDELDSVEDDGTDEPDDDGHVYEDDNSDELLSKVVFTPVAEVEEIPVVQITDDSGRDVIMLYKPERCLTCSYLVGDLLVNGEPTVANDKCHHEFATKGGVRVGNPNCPAKTLRFVKGVNFDKMSNNLAQAMRDKDVAGLHHAYGELAKLDPAVAKRVVSLAEGQV